MSELASMSLWNLSDGSSTPLAITQGNPATAARLAPTHSDDPSGPVAGFLRDNRSSLLPARYPVALRSTDTRDVRDLLERRWRDSGRTMDAFVPYAQVLRADESGCALLLLSRDQIDAVADTLALQVLDGPVLLSNGQIVDPVVLDEGGQWADRSSTMEMRRIRYAPDVGDELLVADGIRYFESSPSGRYAGRLVSSHSFRCLLSTVHRNDFPTEFVVVRNPLLERSFRGLDMAVPVLIDFDDDVDEWCVVVDETVATGIGLRPGEVVSVEPLYRRGPRSSRRALSFRHSLCRVHASNTTDMEKPVVRLPEEVFDIIGVAHGSRVVVESFADGAAEEPAGRISVRALPWRADEWPNVGPGVPDFYRETGSRDLPPITLDLACQQALRTKRGAAVYVRPALGSLAIEEASNGAFAVVVGALGAAVLGSALIAAGFVALFVVLVGFQLWRRLN